MIDEDQPQTDEDRLANEIAARRPGRKPKAAAALKAKREDQPHTEIAPPGTEFVAGSVETGVVAAPATVSNLARVIMKRNYHPINDFLIDGKPPNEEQRVKVFAGAVIDMDRAEAKTCYAAGIVAPYDPFG